MLQHLEEKIKKTVFAHTGSSSGTWQDMLHRLNCTTALSVYCDCSVIAGRYHLGVCIVGLGTCKLYGRTLDTKFPEVNVAGEIEAITFAFCSAQEFITSGGYDTIKSMIVFSDVDHIQRLLSSDAGQTHQPIVNAVQEFRRHKKLFSAVCPGVRIHINYLGNTAQKQNVYYKAAHQVARKVAQDSSSNM